MSYWVGYLFMAQSGPGSSDGDVFRAGADFHPNPDGGWGSYVSLAGPFTRQEAIKHAGPVAWNKYLVRARAAKLARR